MTNKHDKIHMKDNKAFFATSYFTMDSRRIENKAHASLYHPLSIAFNVTLRLKYHGSDEKNITF
jgi:hypothetical protein